MTAPAANCDFTPLGCPEPCAHSKVWRTIQICIWLGGIALLLSLIFAPDAGLHFLWHILIPIAPALFIFAPGVWRNVCPLGFTSLLPWNLGLSRRHRLKPSTQGIAYIGSVVLLLLILPLRHVFFNSSALASALAISVLAALALLAGFLFERKSGWCASLCPIYPVESLYGSCTPIKVRNAHCNQCYQCVQVCPESRFGTDPTGAGTTRFHQLAGVVMTGGFAGFVWGWFHAGDYAGGSRWHVTADAYAYSFGGFAATLAIYLILSRIVPTKRGSTLNRLFACAAVSCYYWYTLPNIFGFGSNPAHAAVNLSTFLPDVTPWIARAIATAVFFWWFIIRPSGHHRWMKPPPRAPKPVEIRIRSKSE